MIQFSCSTFLALSFSFTMQLFGPVFMLLSWGVSPRLFLWSPLIINETEVSKETLQRWWSGPRAASEAWESVVLLLGEDLESKGPAALMCFSGSGSLKPLFSLLQRCSERQHWAALLSYPTLSLWCNQVPGWGYNMATECAQFWHL